MKRNKQLEQLVSLIDLTSLNYGDDTKSIDDLCKIATTPYGEVAAICVYSQFAKHVKEQLQPSSKIKIATVINFPCGMTDLETTVLEIALAISRKVDEIDLVFPYHALLKGDAYTPNDFISIMRLACFNKTLKVIIETGEIKDSELIELASDICVRNNVDFIKTSTGKVPINATLKASEIILKTIKQSGKKCGFKASGGIKTIAEATQYIKLASKIMGKEWITPDNFRFGTSSLLYDILGQTDKNSNY